MDGMPEALHFRSRKPLTVELKTRSPSFTKIGLSDGRFFTSSENLINVCQSNCILRAEDLFFVGKKPESLQRIFQSALCCPHISPAAPRRRERERYSALCVRTAHLATYKMKRSWKIVRVDNQGPGAIIRQSLAGD